MFFVVSVSGADKPAVEKKPVELKPLAEIQTITLVRQVEAEYGQQMEMPVATFTVEVVSDIVSITKGLSGRNKMPPGHGMLFVIREGYQFWMKGMKFALDLVFFDAEQKVIGIMQDQRPCTLCQLIQITEDTAYALEINAGLVKKYDIRTGDRFVVQQNSNQKTVISNE